MMNLATLPLDILLKIFEKMTVQDILRVGMSCKSLHSDIQNYHVWLSRAKDLRIRIPILEYYSPSLVSLSAMELKQEAIRQARLDARWQMEQPVTITMKELTYPDCIHYARFLPGAEFLVLALRRSISLSRMIKQDGEFSIDKVAEFVIKIPVKIVFAKAIYTKEEGMFLAAQAVRLDNRREELYIFHPDSRRLSITMVRRICLDGMFVDACAQGNILACLYDIGDLRLYLLITFLHHPNEDQERKLVFNLGYNYAGGDRMCMPTPHTLVLSSFCDFRVYHLPDISLSSPYEPLDQVKDIHPVWEWMGMERDVCFEPNIIFWDESRPHNRLTVHFTSEHNIHALTFVSTGEISHLVVDNHVTTPVQSRSDMFDPRLALHTRPFLHLNFEKGLWYRPCDSRNPTVLRTISLANPTRLGSIQFTLDESVIDDRLLTWLDFDEISGRLLVGVATNRSRFHHLNVFITDTV